MQQERTLQRVDGELNEMYGQYVKNELFLIPKRYELKRMIGKSDHSVVW
jgi:hypothetical protein